MSYDEGPLVSILTPVYNGAAYLAECIESVLEQAYSCWEYIIVDNCSTDETYSVAKRYANMDPRIHIHHFDELLPIIANHNRAFNLISPDSKYCKVVSADDWLYPDCLMRMVKLAEANPSVGIVGCYQLSGGGDKWYVRTDGLPYYCTVVPGCEIGQAHLLGKLDVLGNPTSTLYRADLVRNSAPFYPNPSAEADISACFKCLRVSDFGFVHQVLAYERVHQAQITTMSKSNNAYLGSKISDLDVYGPSFLIQEEHEKRRNVLLDEYYKYLAVSLFGFRGARFWKYHKKRLSDLGYPFDNAKLVRAMASKIADLALNPKRTIEGVARRAVTAHSRRSARVAGHAVR